MEGYDKELRIKEIKEYLGKVFFNNLKEILEIVIIILCFFLPDIFAFFMKKVIIDFKFFIKDNIILFLIYKRYYKLAGILLSVLAFFKIRDYNKTNVYNKSNFYHDQPYWCYWICSKFLGYEKCDLILVPIYMQYKLVLKDTFKEYCLDGNHYDEDSSEIFVENKNKDKTSNIYNLIIQDTYPIFERQLPNDVKMNSTYVIKRQSSDFGKRVYSNILVDKVVETVRLLPEDSIVNIFSTTNPKNTYEIIKNAFYLSNRGNISHIFVFQQDNFDDRKFSDKPHKVL